jgi:hypothetical protein
MTVYFNPPTRDSLGFLRMTGDVEVPDGTYLWTYVHGELRVHQGLTTDQLLRLFAAIGEEMETLT